MKLLLEQSFPARQSALLHTPFVSTERSSRPNATDRDLVDDAAETGSSAVVFLGRHALGRPDVLSRASEGKVAVVATETMNPLDAIDYLHDNIGVIRRRLSERAEALLVQRGRVLQFTIDELLARGVEDPLS